MWFHWTRYANFQDVLKYVKWPMFGNIDNCWMSDKSYFLGYIKWQSKHQSRWNDEMQLVISIWRLGLEIYRCIVTYLRELLDSMY
jgi:hypothetical protein